MTRQADGTLPFCWVGQIADFSKSARADIDAIPELIELPVTIVLIGMVRRADRLCGESLLDGHSEFGLCVKLG